MNDHKHAFVWSGSGFWLCDCGLGPTDEQRRTLETTHEDKDYCELAARLYAQIAALRKDAERYRWLRGGPANAAVSLMDWNEDGPTDVWYGHKGAELDAAIDAAIAAKEGRDGNALHTRCLEDGSVI